MNQQTFNKNLEEINKYYWGEEYELIDADLCDICHGDGYVRWAHGIPKFCYYCDGNGFKEIIKK